MSMEALLGLFGQHGYWIVFIAILLDNAGLPIPGELLLLVFGALARAGDLDPRLGLIVAAAAAMGGDSFGYWLGRLTGDRIVRAYCRATLGSGTCVRNAESYYDRYGKVTVIFGRFVMGVRAFLPPLAGSARMPFARFVLFDSLGALIWSGLFIALGYGFASRGEWLHDGYRAGSMTIASVLGLGMAVYLLMKLSRRWRAGVGFIGEGPVTPVAEGLRLSSATLPVIPSGPSEVELTNLKTPLTPDRQSGRREMWQQ